MTLEERTRQRRRVFKLAIGLSTVLLSAAMIAATPVGRYRSRLAWVYLRNAMTHRLFGAEPDRSEVEAEWALRRQRGIDEARRSLTGFYRETSPEMRELFAAAGMDPEHALIRYGRGDQAFVISPDVFEPDTHGRSYRFRPKTRSIWLRQITIRNGPFSMFQVLDTPRHREAAGRAGAIVDEGSVQNTNSWGLRGPEPDPAAEVRGIVLGDSFMQAMFNGDEDTPTRFLERELRNAWKLSVSILNTGHIGYSPEQYYHTLAEYGPRFAPQFVVVSLCPNDLGDGGSVMHGEADWLSEADHWLGELRLWCVARNTLLLVVGVPIFDQIESVRRDDLYPSLLARVYHGPPANYIFPLDQFIDEHLRLIRIAASTGQDRSRSLLYNRPIHDDHLSPRGAALWGTIVGRRLIRLFDSASTDTVRKAGSPDAPLNAPAARVIPR